MYAPYRCRTCGKGFSTNSHLRRHEASHISGSSYGCFFCDRSFPRIDTARRHAKRCPQRGDRSMPRTLKSGKPRASCDYCALTKTGCDEDVLCGTCLSNSLTCTYSRISGTSQPNSPRLPRISPSEEEDKAVDADTRELQECTDPAQKVRIPFLLNFYRETNSCRDFYAALESGRPEHGRRCRSPTISREAAVVPLDPAQDGLFEEGFGGLPFFEFPGVDSWSQGHVDGKVSGTMAESQGFGFKERGEEILKELRLTADCSGMAPERAQDRLHSAAVQGLFSATNLLEYTQLYMQCFRRHCPIIALPVSRISCVSLPLLVAIFLGGSILSYPRDTYYLAIECFDLAEEYIFGLPVFTAGCKDHGAPESQLPTLAEPLIAAVIIINFQVGRNDPAIRRRIRHERFPALVSAARSLSLFKTNHQKIHLQPAWNDLAFKEKESLIRTATYIFLLDCQFVACFRSPPLITIAEFTGDLPCDEVRFSTEESSLSAFRAYKRSPSLVVVIDILMDDSQERLDDVFLRPVSVFGLFAVVGGLYSMIFSAFANRAIRYQLPWLRRELSRWHLLWETCTSQNSEDELGLIGFMMCGEEIWLLARALLQTDPDGFAKGLDCDSLVPFRSLVRHAHELSSRLELD